MVERAEEAVDILEQLLSIPSSFTPAVYRLHPVLDPLRDHPRFQALLEKYDSQGI